VVYIVEPYWVYSTGKPSGTTLFFSQVISLAEEEYLQGKLKEVIPGVIRGYSHSESSVRKASVFCLVAIHSVVGDKLRDHLTKLSSSQVRGQSAWQGGN